VTQTELAIMCRQYTPLGAGNTHQWEQAIHTTGYSLVKLCDSGGGFTLQYYFKFQRVCTVQL